MEIPIFLKHLPTYRGYPVPYFVPKDENGTYQLKYASAKKMQSCIAYKKCCVCFKKLTPGEYYFISGPMGLHSQTDSHPPMHKCCAEYSLQVCPHLFYHKTHRTTNPQDAATFQVKEKPSTFYLVHAKKVRYVEIQNAMVSKYSSHSVRGTYEYEKGILKKVP